MFPTRRITTTGGDVFRDEFSLAFDGSNDYVEISDVPSFNYNVNSISIWVNPAAESGSMSLFDYRDANNDGVHIFLGDGDVTYQIDNTDGHYDTKLPLNQWSHILCTNDGSTSTIYVNGVSVETADTSGETINVSGSAVIRIGARSHTSSNNFFQGNISEVAIYDKALSASEAKTLYNGREPYNHKEGVCSSNLQGWWRMGDGVLDGHNLIADQNNLTLGPNLWTLGDVGPDSAGGSDPTVSASMDISTNNLNVGDVLKLTAVIEDSNGGRIIAPDKGASSNGVQMVANTSTPQGTNSHTSNGRIERYVYVEDNSSTKKFKIRTDYDGINGTANDTTQKMTNIEVRKLSQAGVMTSMSANAIKGDTP